MRAASGTTVMRNMVEMVLDKYDGSLKAEHGTGIDMAPLSGANRATRSRI